MRTLLYWALGLVAFLLLVAASVTLLSDVESAPTVVDARAFPGGAGDASWIRLEDASYVWTRGVTRYKARSKGADERKDVVYYVPIVSRHTAYAFRQLKPDEIVALARFDAAYGKKEFGITGEPGQQPPVKSFPCVGMRRPYRVLGEEARAELESRFDGIAGTPILDLGRAPFQKKEAFNVLAVGVGLGVLWLIWRRRRRGGPAGGVARVQRLQAIVFSLLGKLAKADGRVSAEEIAAVEDFMRATRMDAAARARAIAVFNRAKQDDRPIRRYATEFTALEPDLRMRHSVYGVMFAVACADGRLEEAERAVLRDLVGAFALPPDTFDAMEREFAGAAPKAPLDRCYELLGCTAATPDDELKRAYLEKMRQFHPDKIQGKDLAPEFLEYAKQQSQALQNAYETVRKARGAA